MDERIDIEIAAPLLEVWRVYSDVDAWPRWMPTVTRLTRLDDAPLGVGCRARISQPSLPAAIWEIIRWEPPGGWAWQTGTRLGRTVAEHDLEPLATDRTRVVLTIRHEGRLAPVGRRLTGRLSAAYLAREAQALKERCETGSDSLPRHRPDGFRW